MRVVGSVKFTPSFAPRQQALGQRTVGAFEASSGGECSQVRARLRHGREAEHK